VFPSDLWLWLWLAAALTDLAMVRRLKVFFAVSAGLVAVFYAHGMFRPTLIPELSENHLFYLSETDLFQGGRELVVALRFLSWLWAGRVVCDWFAGTSRERTPSWFGWVLAVCLALAGALTALDPFVPWLRAALGRIYHFNLAWVAATNPVVWEKLRLTDLQGRSWIWELYFRTSARRLDLLALGYGFAPYHTDSSYVFLFTRGGFVGLLAFGFWLHRLFDRNAWRWDFYDRAAVLFLLIAGLTLDAFIFRHVVALMIAVALPRLSRRAAVSDPRA
jgi:hypothetical protein